MKYYAYAWNGKQIEQLLVTIDKTKSPSISQVWTGKTYETAKKADQDMIKLND